MAKKAFYLHDDGREFCSACRDLLIKRYGLIEVHRPLAADVAIAPCLRRKLPKSEWDAPVFGTLIFHPSILPYRRGPDAIKWAIHQGERVSGVTWFWCDDGLDVGDICEQEPVVLMPDEPPKTAYLRRFIPAGLRALDRALFGIVLDSPRRVPQDHKLATYDPKFCPTAQV